MRDRPSVYIVAISSLYSNKKAPVSVSELLGTSSSVVTHNQHGLELSVSLSVSRVASSSDSVSLVHVFTHLEGAKVLVLVLIIYTSHVAYSTTNNINAKKWLRWMGISQEHRSLDSISASVSCSRDCF